MANIQTSFIDFHNSIRLDVEDNTLLKDYKDQVIDGLKDYLPDDVKFETFTGKLFCLYRNKSCDEKLILTSILQLLSKLIILFMKIQGSLNCG